MAETNYYQAPESAEPSDVLGQKLASLLLKIRQSDYSLGFHYRMQLKGYLVLFLLIGLGIAYFAWLQLEPAAFVMFGALVGVLLRDFGLARQQKKVWRIQKTLLDWGKVERMAAGEPIDT